MSLSLGYFLFVGSSLAAPDTVWVLPEEGLTALFTSWYETDQVYMVSGLFRWTVDRKGVHLVDAAETSAWAYSTPYRVDRASGRPDTIVGRGDDATVDLIDGTRPSLWPEPLAVLDTLNDVDGDGTVDLLVGNPQVLLTSFDNPRIVSMPPGVQGGEGPLGAIHPMPDLDGDGHAELLDAVPDHLPGPYAPPVTGSDLYLYDGNPNGYDDLARWWVRIDSGLLDMVALQADDDPELELLGLLTTELTYSWADGVHTVLIDDVASDLPTVSLSPGQRGIQGKYASTDYLSNLGDIDGDGLDDVVVSAAYFDENEEAWYDLAILSSAYDWDLTQPAAQFRIGVQQGKTYEHTAMAVDADRDGLMDLVAVRQSSVDTIQVWFGPLYELPEPPEHTATTGDTGLTTDTAVSTPTADTDTATTDSGTPDTTASAPKPGTPEASGCGCGAAPRAGGLWPRRR